MKNHFCSLVRHPELVRYDGQFVCPCEVRIAPRRLWSLRRALRLAR